MCLYPRMYKNQKYVANKKNGGIVPPFIDERVLFVPIGCGNCIECSKQKSRAWQVRLLEDVKHNKNGKFITLTFSDESYKDLNNTLKQKLGNQLLGYTLDNSIAKLAMKLFLNRWRKHHKKSIRHWLVTELGHNGTKNIHLHGIIWTDKDLKEVEKIWQYGYVWKGKEINGKIINYVNEKTVNYITKYVSKQDLEHKYYKPLVLTSSGIGNQYTNTWDATNNQYNGTSTKEHYRTRTGHKVNLPIYWRNKIYNDEQREQLWLQKLDKLERWVCGEKIDISKTERDYYRLLEYYREENRRLGYSDFKIDWKKYEYEQQSRVLQQMTRIAKGINKDNRKKAPSAGSLSKGLGLNIGPLQQVETGPHKIREQSALNAAFERHQKNQIWIIKNMQLNLQSKT